jgi:ribosomal protein S18 acetylase RimI-like enzyme
VTAEDLTFRRPTEADHPAIVGVVDEWWGGRRLRHLLPRLWLQHFTGTSWVAETPEGRLAGFLIGFISPDRPDEAYVHMAAIHPSRRRHGHGRALYERFIDDVRARGVRKVTAVTWPGNKTSLAFHQALGFEVDAGPGTQSLYGVPARTDYDDEWDDKAVLTRYL